MIDNVVIEDEVLQKFFTCNLKACKGECCIAGSGGAPLEASELEILDEIWEDVKPYLSHKAIKTIEKNGKYIKIGQREWETPLIQGRECAYVIYNNGVYFCGIEKAYLEGKITFQKPISCHLYPIRLEEENLLTRMTYEYWNICTPACKKGLETQLTVYQFCKDSIIRKFGQEFYNQLDALAKYIQ